MQPLGLARESKIRCQIELSAPPASLAVLSEVPSTGLRLRGTTHSNIDRGEFNRLLPHHLVLEGLMGEQVEWFTNRAKSLIGTIALTKTGRSWNYAILRRNRLGHFQVCDIGQNFFSLKQTMVQFTYAMVAAKKDRHANCPISD
jgi:hypothetical protein